MAGGANTILSFNADLNFNNPGRPAACFAMKDRRSRPPITRPGFPRMQDFKATG